MSNMVEAPAICYEHLTPAQLVEELSRSPAWVDIDKLEAFMEALPVETHVEYPVKHIFTPGLYCREIYMFAPAVITSRIHLFEHPFVISQGAVEVWDDINGWVKLSAPYTGVTFPGTRRVIKILEDTIWTTFHVTDKTDPDEIVRDITYSKGKYEQLGYAAAAPLSLWEERAS